MTIEVLFEPAQPNLVDDLAEWLRARGLQARADGGSPEHMGAAETVSVIVAGAATLRAYAPVLIEWIRARNTTVRVRSRDGLEYTLSTSSDSASITELIEAIGQSATDGPGPLTRPGDAPPDGVDA